MNFKLHPTLRNTGIALLLVGIISLVYAFFIDDYSHAAHHESMAHAAGAHGSEHADHSAHNRPWAALMVNTFFFLAISLGALFFLAIQYAAQAGWSVGIKRVLEAIAGFLPVPGIVMLIIVLSGVLLHKHHIWHWTVEGISDPNSPNYDAIIAGKTPYLNAPFYLIRTIVYIVGWYIFLHFLKKNSYLGDQSNDWNWWRKNWKLSAGFLVFFAVTSSTSAWDWIMSIDTHWFSTLFGWYVFAGLFVTSVTVVTLTVLYLKSQNYLSWVNENHLQDLAKFMFAFSIFWTYLWFSQYMLIWYSNIPEEVTYYMPRFTVYKVPFITMLALNFAFPILVIMSRTTKRIGAFVVIAGISILIGHWLDTFNMIMPGTVGENYSFGIAEIGIFLGYAGAFILVVGRNLEKAPLLMKNHPMLLESKHHHI
ncbi:quinol:cytochrome C oxidoreductase [Thermaurantimonas aggregans]|uniref:Quinol:cytochrome C oxidoreductase n=1 Tax=Thermaurantimonas aggregans TaxID=2173829 RepID=A0A401XJJ9_9FLAO|nr:quinol:cytochrome C oxidoreductase [Thermaurantimonas aggregans]MCX8148720.1 quinol:cytochrome C oxidoreductase [Thermaurantimonas aggregans]GCD77186.1 quinol:cytochrome C oxidoreductase [Thermaurantimonas aggregans]